VRRSIGVTVPLLKLVTYAVIEFEAAPAVPARARGRMSTTTAATNTASRRPVMPPSDPRHMAHYSVPSNSDAVSAFRYQLTCCGIGRYGDEANVDGSAGTG
jgi:hypothetical protein